MPCAQLSHSAQTAAQPDAAAKSESAAPIYDMISESAKATNLDVQCARATKLGACTFIIAVCIIVGEAAFSVGNQNFDRVSKSFSITLVAHSF